MKKISIRQLLDYPDKIARELRNGSKDGMLLTSGDQKFVVLAESEYNSIYETLHLMSTKANVKRLLEGINQAENKVVKEIEDQGI